MTIKMDNILVCVKQVPNTTNIKLDPIDHTLIREGISNILNPLDEYAIEAALDCKKKYGIRVAIVSMGPKQAKEILHYCMARGADEAFLLTDKKLAGSDTLATARALSALIRKTNYRNVFCGQESIDSSTGHIGSSIAELLDLPQVNYISDIIKFFDNKLRLKTQFEYGFRIIEVKLPAVLSFIRSEKKISKSSLDSGKKSIKIFSLNNIGLSENVIGIKGSPTWVININKNEYALNYFKVNSSLSARERIKAIISGGIKEKKDRLILNNSSDETIKKVVNIINSF
jgi:electron transfer flavoprotein beta subunit